MNSAVFGAVRSTMLSVSKAFDQSSINIIRLWTKTCWNFSLIFKRRRWRKSEKKFSAQSFKRYRCSIHYEFFIKQHEIFISSSCRCFIIANVLTIRQVYAYSHRARLFCVLVLPERKTFCLLVCFYDTNISVKNCNVELLITTLFVSFWTIEWAIPLFIVRKQRHWTTTPCMALDKKDVVK